MKIKIKPRGQLRPLHIQENIINEYNTSELVNWADVVVAHSTSILIEAIIKNKKILFLNFLYSLEDKRQLLEGDKYVFENQYIVEYINSKEDLIKRIHSLKSAESYIGDNKKYQESKKFFLKKNLDDKFFDRPNNLNEDLINIYQS